jgi:hypothetical protein
MPDAIAQPSNARSPAARRGPDRGPISAKRLAANRRNPRKSTGPRTPEGKARSALNALRSTGPRSVLGRRLAARNALKHGAWADEPVPPVQAAAFAEHARRVAVEHGLRTEAELNWGLELAIALWQLGRLADSQASAAWAADVARGGKGTGSTLTFEDLTRHTEAEIRLNARVLLLLRKRPRRLPAGARPAGAGPAGARRATARRAAVEERSEPTRATVERNAGGGRTLPSVEEGESAMACAT